MACVRHHHIRMIPLTNGHPMVAALLAVFTGSIFFSTALVNVLAAVISGVALYHWLRFRPIQLLWHPISVGCILFLAWVMARELIDGQPLAQSLGAMNEFRPLVFIVLWAPLLRPLLHRRAVIYTTVAGLLIFSLFALATLVVTGMPFYIHYFDPGSVALPRPLDVLFATLHKRAADLSGPVMVATIFAGLQCAWDAPRHRKLLLPLSAIGIAALVFALARRTSYVGLMVCSLLIVLLNARRINVATAAWLSGAALGAASLLLASPLASQGLGRIVDEAVAFQSTPAAHQAQLTTSTGLRLQYWSVASRIAQESPLIGTGITSFPSHYRAEAARLGGEPQAAANPHNEYLYVFSALGGVGMLFYLTAHLTVLRNGAAMHNVVQRKVLYCYFAAALSSILFNSMFIDMIPGHFHALAVLTLGWFDWDTGDLPRSAA